MKLKRILVILAGFLLPFAAHSQQVWKVVDEGLRFTIPSDWEKQNVQPVDSNAGSYRGKRADLEFDEVVGLGYTQTKSKSKIHEMERKRANPKLLKKGEEIWRVGGRLAEFWFGKVDPKVYGQRRFTNVATLFIPYEGERRYLDITIFYQSAEDLPTAKRVLKSIEWQKQMPKKSARMDGCSVAVALAGDWHVSTHGDRCAK